MIIVIIVMGMGMGFQGAPDVRLPRTRHFCACRVRKENSQCLANIELVRRPFCRRGSCTFTEVARLVPSGAWAPSTGPVRSRARACDHAENGEDEEAVEVDLQDVGPDALAQPLFGLSLSLSLYIYIYIYIYIIHIIHISLYIIYIYIHI